jgi:hypothetical protein
MHGIGKINLEALGAGYFRQPPSATMANTAPRPRNVSHCQ